MRAHAVETNDLYQLVYVSQSGEHVDQASLEKIRKQCQENNSKLGITGVLLLGGGCFLQLLEGPRDALAKVYGKISLDDRHSQPNVLYAGPIKARSASEWSMGVVDARPTRPEAVFELAVKLESIDTSIDNPGDALASLFREITQMSKSA